MKHSITPFFTPVGGLAKRVYISGPMSGLIDNNTLKFDDAAGSLRGKGYAVCSPAETAIWLGDLEHAQFLRFDFERILEADFLVVLSGWEDSNGARAEILMALRIGLRCWLWDSWPEFNQVTLLDVTEALSVAEGPA